MLTRGWFILIPTLALDISTLTLSKIFLGKAFVVIVVAEDRQGLSYIDPETFIEKSHKSFE